jgi:hypothetical protein
VLLYKISAVLKTGRVFIDGLSIVRRSFEMKKTVCALSIGLLGAGIVCADVLAEFTFTKNSRASSDTSLNSAVSEFNVGAGSISGDLVSTTADLTTQSGDVDPAGAGAQYDSFTLTVTGLRAGETLNLTSLTYVYTVIRPLNMAIGVYSSVDGFNSSVAQLDGVDTGIDYATPQTFNQTVFLSGTGFKGLLNNDTIEFRFYLADTSTGIGRIHQLDSIVLDGTVSVIPKPTAIGLLGMGAIITFLLRKNIRR